MGVIDFMNSPYPNLLNSLHSVLEKRNTFDIQAVTLTEKWDVWNPNLSLRTAVEHFKNLLCVKEVSDNDMYTILYGVSAIKEYSELEEYIFPQESSDFMWLYQQIKKGAILQQKIS